MYQNRDTVYQNRDTVCENCDTVYANRDTVYGNRDTVCQNRDTNFKYVSAGHTLEIGARNRAHGQVETCQKFFLL